jgi:predicted TPR repeat methyltransferase
VARAAESGGARVRGRDDVPEDAAAKPVPGAVRPTLEVQREPVPPAESSQGAAGGVLAVGRAGRHFRNVRHERNGSDAVPARVRRGIVRDVRGEVRFAPGGQALVPDPDMLRTLVDSTVGPRTYQSALDLGCGTGLSGLAFRSCVSACLRGADLSPEMVDTARQTRPGCYDELVVGDVLSQSTYEAANRNDTDGDDHGSHRASRWDLIYACDVFVYLGDLSPVFAMVSKHLGDDDGVFAFSTELLPNDSDDEATEGPPYKLQSTGRFAHSVSYLNELAGTHHLCVRATTIRPIRKNAGRDILGCLVVLSKAHSTASR